jgi:hypothetical protein
MRKQLPKVNCTYGAPMGRRGVHCSDAEIPFRFAMQRVRLNSGGYDDGAHTGASDSRSTGI